ncbi:MAG: hypothetical protein O9322_04585 [Beijerinckiaceae bacterium]|nr:hypothetical protein [Beijerinckiaceae bacterium]MCZ8298798.1 hypothetical protein [Beijerinckiaceae bacterium]
MLRGHIDHVSASRVEGWVHSPDFPVKGRRVFAFIGKICVGGGLVDVFRRDLAEAGLGDGILGFGFDIYLEQPLPLSRLVVTFEACDFILPQTGAEMRGRDETGAVIDYEAERVQWRFMFGRGWLEESAYRLLSDLARFGCREMLVPESGNAPEEAAHAAAAAILGLNALRNAPILRQEIDSLDILQEKVRNVPRLDGVRPPLVALWSASTYRLNVAEWSHRLADPAQKEQAAEGAVEYSFGGATMLFLNAECALRLPRLAQGDQLILLWHAASADAEPPGGAIVWG